MSALDKIAKLLDLFGGNQSAYGVPFANRNYIVDGNFDNWIATSQVLGVAGLSNNAATMYHCYSGASGNATVSQGTFGGTEPVGMTSPARYYMSFAQTVASTGTVAAGTSPFIYQAVESVETLQGRAATFSCWLWAAAPMTITQVEAIQNFGTGGSPSAPVTTQVPVTWNLTTVPQRFSVLLNVPSTAGKTLGTSNNDSLQVALQLPPGATYTVNTAQWQLEQSSPQAPAAGYPTAFEYRGQQAELARVQRYYATTTTQLISSGTGTDGGDSKYAYYPVTMRAVPTATPTNGGGSYGGSFAVGPTTGFVNVYFSTAQSAGVYAIVNFVLDARL